MPKHQNLICALKDGQITSIADVESGLKCGCICPACGEPLVAKKGSKVVHHFAHHAGKNCEYGYQTSLHLAAKDILSKAKKMIIPAVVLDFPGSCKREIISEEIELSIDHVELERRFGDVIPDVVVYAGKKCFFVEIYVTHPVDEEKLAKLEKANISTIEIDLSEVDRMISPDELKLILLQSSESKKWIYNAARFRWMDKFRKAADRRSIDHSYTSRVYNCPIYMRTWGGRVYADMWEDCATHCEYCLGCFNRYILCSGRRQIAHTKDFNIPEDIRSKQREALIQEQKAEIKEPRYCPICGAKMDERWGRFGKFWGCSRYPQCEGTISAEDE